MYQNLVIIMGNLSRKPELKTFNGGQLTSLSIAINKVWFDKETKEKKESVEFVSVTVFGKQAENCVQYLDKGQKVYVEGFIKNRVEETDAGKRYHTGIVAEKVQFGPKTGAGGTNTHSEGESTPQGNVATNSGTKKGDMDPIDYPEEDIDISQIPF